MSLSESEVGVALPVHVGLKRHVVGELESIKDIIAFIFHGTDKVKTLEVERVFAQFIDLALFGAISSLRNLRIS